MSEPDEAPTGQVEPTAQQPPTWAADHERVDSVDALGAGLGAPPEAGSIGRVRWRAAQTLLAAHDDQVESAWATLYAVAQDHRRGTGALDPPTHPAPQAGTGLAAIGPVTTSLTSPGPAPRPAVPARERSGRTLVEVKDLSKVYKVGKQRVHALDGVSLTIDEGEFVALVGASGSGKSTLLQLIGGLDKPTGGNVVVDGSDLGRMRDGKLSRFRGQTIGFVFQFFYLQPFLQLVTNTEVPGMFAHRKRKPRREQAMSLINEVGLADRARHLPKEMSGGQMQRAAIARALLNTPKLLLADEPTGNLDSVTGATIMDLFEQIRAESGTTIVMVTHDEDMAARADRTVRLKDGRIMSTEQAGVA